MAAVQKLGEARRASGAMGVVRPERVENPLSDLDTREEVRSKAKDASRCISGAYEVEVRSDSGARHQGVVKPERVVNPPGDLNASAKIAACAVLCNRRHVQARK